MKYPKYRRSTYEVRMEVLAAIEQGCEKKSQIKQEAHTSWKLVQTSLDALQAGDLITVTLEKGGNHYCLTDKGRLVVQSYRENREAVGMPL